MNRPHTFSPASSLSYSNQVGSRQVTQPLRCVESPAGAGGAAVRWERVTGGRDWGQGARGQHSALSKYGRGCPAACAGPGPRLSPTCWRLALSSPLTSLLFLWGSGAARLRLRPRLFCPSERGKRKQRNKKILCVSHRSQRRAPGKREGRSRKSLAGLSTSRGSSRSLRKGPSASKQTQHTVCRAGAAAQEGLSKAAFQNKGLCLPLHTKPHIFLADFSGKAPQPWCIKQHQDGRHLPAPLGFCVAVPRGWDQLCLSPNLKAMWTSLQESPRPSPGVNTSSLTTPRRFSTACAFTLLFISPPQGSVQFLPRGICSAQIMQCLAKDTEGPSVLSLLTSTGHPSLGTLPTLSVEIGSKHSCPKGPDLTRPHETPCPQGQQTRHKPKAPVA